MKRIGLISAALLFIMAFGNAHPISKIEGIYIKDPSNASTKMEKREMRRLDRKNEINVMSIDKFNTDFGSAKKVVWSKSNYFDEARFVKNGKHETAYFNYDGKLVGTTQNKSFSDLPAYGQKQIKRMYKGYKIDGVVFYNDNQAASSDISDIMLYGSQFENPDNYFVELSKGKDNIIVQVSPDGSVYFFKQLYS